MPDRVSGSSSPSATRERTAPPGAAGPAAPRRLPRFAAEVARPLPAAADATDAQDRDIRRRRPPVLSFLLRRATLRRAARIVSLPALDFIGVTAAIFTALVLKEVILHGTLRTTRAVHGTEDFLPFAYLLTALLFARSGLYAERGLRPGLSRIVGSLFQVAVVALVFAVVSGEHFSSYYLFYGGLAFAIFYVAVLRAIWERATLELLRAAGYQRRALVVGRDKHIGDVARALTTQPHSPVEVVGFLATAPIADNWLTPRGTLRDL